MAEDTNLKVNGKIISLNDFMQSMLKNLILGYLKCTKGVPEDIKQINIENIAEDINLKVNGKKISLKDFMQSMLKNLILGYLKSAKGVPEDVKQINIEINF